LTRLNFIDRTKSAGEIKQNLERKVHARMHREILA
jgi:hypothetical protein